LPGRLLSRESAIKEHFTEVFLPVYTCADIKEGGGRTNVIYLIFKDGEVLVETDDIEYVKSYMSKNQECSVRDARTGKKIPLE
jgi:hypothetical protein